MSALLSLDEAQRHLGINRSALVAAVDRGDVSQVEVASSRGNFRKYITASSVDAWIRRLNGEPEAAKVETEDVVARIESRILGLSMRMTQLAGRVDDAIVGMGSRQEKDRRARLRHTVSSRIGDAFDPHGFYVYILWGVDDETPLYIGQSRNVLSRLGYHMTDKAKRYEVKSVQLIKCSGKRTMDRTEAALIREYKPPLNTMGVHPVAVAR